MNAIEQIKCHVGCLRHQCKARRWNRITFHLKGIWRACNQPVI